MADKKILEEETIYEEVEETIKVDSTEPSQGIDGFYQKNKNIIFGVVAVIAIMVVGGMWYMKTTEANNITAKDEMVWAVNQFEANRDSSAIYGDGQNSGFEDIADSYGNTKSGNLAKLYLGLSYLRLGQIDDGISTIESYKSNGDMLSSAAFGALAYAYEEQSEFSNAARSYERAAINPAMNDFTTPMYWMDAARVYELDDQNDKALKLYKKIKKNYPNSEQGASIDKYIARISK